MFEFSWATLSLIDVGVLSISMLGLWWLKNQVDRYKTLSEELERRYRTLQQEYETLKHEHETLKHEHITLQQEYRTFQSSADRRYSVLQERYERTRSGKRDSPCRVRSRYH